jgi:PEP-CTERM motif
MKLIPKLSLSIALALGAAASASADVINFDNLLGARLNAGELVVNQYSGLGVTFLDSFSGGAHAENFLGSFIPGSTSPNVLWADQGGGSTTGQYLQISFASAVSNVSALFGTSLSADITMQAFSGASMIDTTTLTGAVVTGDVRSGLISLGDAGITSVRLFSHSGASSFNFSIDNLTYQTAAVPEPETYALMLAGLGAVGMMARRRKLASAA